MHFCAWCTLYQDTQLQRVSLLHVICRKVRDHYDPPTAASAALVRAQQPPSHVAQGFLHSFPYPSPGSSTKPGRALPPPMDLWQEDALSLHAERVRVWVCSQSSTQEGQETHLSVTSSPGRSPTRLQAVHKERRKRKKIAELSLPLRCFSQSLPLLLVAVAKMSKLWVQCTWEDQDKSLKGGMGEHPTALQCRQGLL